MKPTTFICIQLKKKKIQSNDFLHQNFPHIVNEPFLVIIQAISKQLKKGIKSIVIIDAILKEWFNDYIIKGIFSFDYVTKLC